MQRLMDWLDSLEAWQRNNWQAWPAAMLGFALLTWTCALLVEPRPDNWVYLFGHQVGETCALIQVAGVPCPSCGMTRSFAWAARFQWITSWLYNPAGLTLFLSITGAGLLGAARLATSKPNLWTLPYNPLVIAVLSWTTGLYVVPWLLRVAGINPLP
jgi:hypothetical protein